MKWLLFLLVLTPAWPDASDALSKPTSLPPPFSSDSLVRGDDGHGELLINGRAWSVGQVLKWTPWELMTAAQSLTGTLMPLSEFGMGDDDPLTNEWRLRLAAFAASKDISPPPKQADLFDPRLVLWDPGFLQHKNEWGQWTVTLDRRDIVQSDIATLSPLEVQQAVRVLTGRVYPIEFVVEHLEAFRAQLSVVPRLAEASAADGTP